MAKSKNPRILIDETTGKEYLFNPNALKKIIHSHTDRKNHITQTAILQQIEEHCNFTADQVKKWLYGANGIGNMDNAKRISDFLKIDYHEILIDMNPTKEEKKMFSDEEKSIIKQTFGECVSVLYKVQELANSPKLAPIEKIDQQQKNILEADSLIRNIHLLVDQNSVILQTYDRYNLHKILLELNEYIYGILKGGHSCIPERWDEMSNSLLIEEAISFPLLHDRNLYLENPDPIYSNIYLVDEISLAEEMGLTSCLIPTEAEWDDLSKVDDLTRFGYIPNTERYSLTPGVVWIDLMVKLLTEIFEIDFPELFDNK